MIRGGRTGLETDTFDNNANRPEAVEILIS